jgi:hypothetical protein
LLERQYGSHYLYLNLKKALESAKATIFTLRYLRDDEQNVSIRLITAAVKFSECHGVDANIEYQ